MMCKLNPIQYVVAASLSALTLGCSEVAFSPNPSGKTIQENPDGTRTETFNFNGDRPLTQVDVLFVIDNSGSMAAEQEKLSTRLSSFVDSIVAIDWQIGITTTDVDSATPYNMSGSLVDFVGTTSHVLTRSTPNYEQVFLNTVMANGTPKPDQCSGTGCPSGNEQPLKAAQMAINKRNAANAGFFRDAADLAVIVLSDEDEMSTGNNGGQIGFPTRPEDLISAFDSAFGAGKLLSGFGIIVKPGDSACLGASVDHNYGTFVQRFAELTDGETGSICDSDYGPALSRIGQRVRRSATSVKLSGVPVPGTLNIALIPADPMITWEIIDDVIRLSDLPQKGSRLVVTYKAQ